MAEIHHQQLQKEKKEKEKETETSSLNPGKPRL